MASRFLLPPAIRIVGATFLALAIFGVQASEARWGSAPRTLIVDDDPPELFPEDCQPRTHPTINAAIAAANPGDTVLVCPGVYIEDVLISKTLTFKGRQAGTPGPERSDFQTFNAGAESVVVGMVTVQAPHVVFDGFWVTGFLNIAQSLGVLVKTAACDARILNNVVNRIGGTGLPSPVVGIYLEHGPDRVKVVDNWISDILSAASAQGILVGDSTAADPSRDILLSGNLIERITSATRGAYGIQVNNGASTAPTATGFATVAIRDNTIDDLDGGWAHAIGLEGPTPNVEVVRNTISNLLDITPVPVNDAVAVFFEANPFFPTADVHFNNFNVRVDQFGIALHPDLIASDGRRGKVDGTCNWWNAPDGPGPVGPGSGAMVTTNVDFDPWLDAPAPGGRCFDPHDKCDKDDDDDHDHDGKRNDIDEDVDNDGILNLLDADDDNDGITDLVDLDDDNDGIEDKYDDKATRQVQRTLHHTLGAGAVAEWVLASDGGALPLVALVESPNAQFLKVEIYNPSGLLVGTSLPTPGVAVVTTTGLLPGIYTVRVRNTGVAPIDYTVRLITTMGWLF